MPPILSARILPTPGSGLPSALRLLCQHSLLVGRQKKRGAHRFSCISAFWDFVIALIFNPNILKRDTEKILKILLRVSCHWQQKQDMLTTIIGFLNVCSSAERFFCKVPLCCTYIVIAHWPFNYTRLSPLLIHSTQHPNSHFGIKEVGACSPGSSSQYE